MKNLLNNFFLRSNNLDFISQNIKDFTKKTPVKKIFEAIDNYNLDSEIMYVGGFVRKIINKEKVDDIDLATNLEPKQVIEVLKKHNINYHETGIKHGTITALINNFKFEITTLRKDISTDGRHAQIQFSKDWKEDASRRDFTINAIYSDSEGNLFDPYNGKKDLENGFINFIGDPDKRIKEDYLRILRYLRFYINYSKHSQNLDVIKKLKMNLSGISKISRDRLLDELKKIAKIESLEKLSKDKICLEIFLIIFPELKNINYFSKINQTKKEILKKVDFSFLLSLMIIDETDNSDYFLYKFNVSKKDQKRIRIIDNFFKEKINSKTFTKKNMNKVFYYNGRQAVIDILNFRILKSIKLDHIQLELLEFYKNTKIPMMPIGADFLMNKYKLSEGKQLGAKLKIIEKEWVSNNFKITDQQVENIVKN